MAANANRMVMRFGANPAGGLVTKNEWTETLWNLTDQSPSDLKGKVTGAGPDPILQRRAKLLSKGWMLKSINIYSNQGQRKRSFASIQDPGEFPGTLAEHDEQPYDKVLAVLTTANYSRPLWLGGVPFGVVGPGGNYQGFPPAANADAAQFQKFLLDNPNSYAAALKANGWAMQHLTVSAPFDIKDVHLATTDTPSGTPRTPTIQVAFIGPNPFTDFGKIRISGVVHPANLNGQWTYTVGTVTGSVAWLQLRAKRKLSISGTYDGAGTVVTITPIYEAFTGLEPVRGTSRKVGDGPKSSRGRRSNRRTA